MININDKFTNKKQMIESIEEFARKCKFKYDVSDTGRIYKLNCKGKQEFNCDAHISVTYKKKDNIFIVRKIKLIHKCPSDIQKNLSSSEFIRREIGDLKNLRIGEIVGLLIKRGLKVSYQSVYKALNENMESKFKNDFISDDLKNKSDDNEKENIKNGNDKKKDEETNIKNDESIGAYNHWCEECKLLNPKMEAKATKTSITIVFPWYEKIRPVIELKVIYKKDYGFVAYAIVYDPLDNPLVYSVCVSDNNDDLKEFIKQISKHILIIEFDKNLISICESENVEYFLKVRSLCREVYNSSGSKEEVQKIWNICNMPNTGEINIGIDKKHYKLEYATSELFNIQNFSDIDLDFIYSSIYSLSILDTQNAILKLISDNLRNRENFREKNEILKIKINENRKENKNSIKMYEFGDNVMWRLEKNTDCNVRDGKVYEMNIEYIVDLNKCTCTCGKYQELLIPCVHALALIKSLGKDPKNFVSTIYSKQILDEMLIDVVPVIDEPIKLGLDKSFLKRGPGRPKKSLVSKCTDDS